MCVCVCVCVVASWYKAVRGRSMSKNRCRSRTSSKVCMRSLGG